MLRVERWDGGPAFTPLLAAYMLATEIEKGSLAAGIADLPDALRAYLSHPAKHHGGDAVLVAFSDDAPVGCVVVTEPRDGVCEIKRLWVEPMARRTGAGRLLLREAITAASALGASTVRLTVWSWRTQAIALYVSEGFQEASSWDERDGLVCMERSL
jgi:putative acetyltransferase